MVNALPKALSRVSVCIPCIPEHVRYLEDCLSSISNQTLLPMEVILVVSESTPEIKKEVEELLEKFTVAMPIRSFFFSEKQYAGTNRNLAIKEAKGEIIALIDADDKMYPHRISIVQQFFDHDEYKEALGLLHWFTENPEENSDFSYSPMLEEDNVEAYLYDEDYPVQYGHACYRRSLFFGDKGEKRYQFSDKPREQDVEFIENVFLKDEENNVLRDKLYVYTKPLTIYLSNRSSYWDKYFQTHPVEGELFLAQAAKQSWGSQVSQSLAERESKTSSNSSSEIRLGFPEMNRF